MAGDGRLAPPLSLSNNATDDLMTLFPTDAKIHHRCWYWPRDNIHHRITDDDLAASHAKVRVHQANKTSATIWGEYASCPMSERDAAVTVAPAITTAQWAVSIFRPFYNVFLVNEWTLTQCTFRNENQFFEIANENNKYKQYSVIPISFKKSSYCRCHPIISFIV